MSREKSPEEKTRLHPRNKNRAQYDLGALIKAIPKLSEHVGPDKYGGNSVDFSSPIAVKLLNKAILSHYYGFKHWEFPNENLCPPIPGRADYIHHMADLLSENNFGNIPTGDKVTCLDIGVGASCIYPIIGVLEYGWSFIGSDIDSNSIESAKKIIEANTSLQNKVICQLQKNKKDFFYGIIDRQEKVDLTICNPPFHSSSEEAKKGSRRKVKHVSGKRMKNPTLNFAGIKNELIYEGGEHKFVHDMIRESKKFAKNCLWFSTLLSKKSNLKGVYKSLKKLEANQIKTIPMGTGNKSSQVVAWTYLSKDEQKEWRANRFST